MEAEKVAIFVISQLVSASLKSELDEAGYRTLVTRDLDKLRDFEPEGVIFEFRGEQDIEELKALKKSFEETGLVIYSRLPGSKLIRLLFEFEINALINMEVDRISLIRSVEAAVNGEEYFDEQTLIYVLSDKYRSIYSRIASITSRENDIIKGIMEDLTNDEMAERYGLSVRTVNAHKRNILQKMDVRSLVGLTQVMLKYSYQYD